MQRPEPSPHPVSQSVFNRIPRFFSGLRKLEKPRCSLHFPWIPVLFLNVYFQNIWLSFPQKYLVELMVLAVRSLGKSSSWEWEMHILATRVQLTD